MGQLIQELKRRNVIRVAVAYAVATWLVIQVAETILPLFGYGDAPARIVVILLVIGFIPTLIVAWVFEMTPQGLMRDKDVDRTSSVTWQTGKKFDRMILLLLSVTLVYFALDKFIFSEFREATIAESAREEGRTKARQHWAIEEGLPEVEGLVESDHYIEAYAKALELERIIPEDRRIVSLWQDISESGSIISEPPGADVYYRPYSAPNAEWLYLGSTPLEKVSLPRGALAFRITKAGYAPAYIADFNPGRLLGNVPWIPERGTVTLSRSVPDDQVYVPAVISMSDFPIPDDTGPFLIDAYEVTNQQFKEFVDTGGYEEKSLWDGLVFLDKGRHLTWEDAVQTFTDSTGRQGPATWELGSYPGGQANWPVSGISWYEAVAYTRFRGRDLPTHYHWGRAAMSENLAQAIISMSNFDGEKAAQVGLYTGLGPFGTYDMAGNVREWVWNAWGADRMILGGAWNDPRYMFTLPNSLPPSNRSAGNGFRTVRYIDEGPTEQQLAAIVPRDRDLASLNPLSDDAYAALVRQFDYSRTASSGGEIIASRESSREWRHETVLIDSAYVPGGFKIHVYMPLDAKPPLQSVIFFPGLWPFVVSTPSEADPLIELPSIRDIDFVIRSGRVLIWPVYHGSFERYVDTSGLSSPERINALRLKIVRWRSDVGEVIDYLEGRPDIAADSTAYLGFSYGSLHAPPILALENRIKAAILIAAPLSHCDYESVCNAGSISPGLDPLIDNLHYLPRVQQPTLVLSGEYDSIFLLRVQKALFDLLGTPDNDKKHVVFPIEHGLPPRSALLTHGVDWLDRYLGPAN